MDRRRLLQAAPVAVGMAAGAFFVPSIANADPTIDANVPRLATILGIPLEEAARMWKDEDARIYLPVSYEQSVMGGAAGGVSAASAPGDIGIMANIRFSATHTYKNLFGNILFKVVMQKTTVDNSNPVRGAGAFCTPSTTTLGKTTWISEGPNPSYDIDTAVGTAHRSRRAATWSARGAQGGKVSLAINMTVRVGEYLDVSRQTI